MISIVANWNPYLNTGFIFLRRKFLALYFKEEPTIIEGERGGPHTHQEPTLYFKIISQSYFAKRPPQVLPPKSLLKIAPWKLIPKAAIFQRNCSLNFAEKFVNFFFLKAIFRNYCLKFLSKTPPKWVFQSYFPKWFPKIAPQSYCRKLLPAIAFQNYSPKLFPIQSCSSKLPCKAARQNCSPNLPYKAVYQSRSPKLLSKTAPNNC